MPQIARNSKRAADRIRAYSIFVREVIRYVSQPHRWAYSTDAGFVAQLVKSVRDGVTST